MNQKFSVYVGELNLGERWVRAILAVSNKAQALRLLGITTARFDKDWDLTDDDGERQMALRTPQTVMISSDRFSIDYRPVAEIPLRQAA